MANTLEMRIDLGKISTEYTVFEKDQVLTHTQLNGVADYLDDQTRLTRVDLAGIGIYCGLRATLQGDRVHLSRGVGVTTDGDLVRVPSDIEYRFYRRYDNDERTPHYGKLGSNKTWELLKAKEDHPQAAELTKLPSSAGGMPLNSLSAVLLVESVQRNDDFCSGTDCDNRGDTATHTLRLLLVDASAAAGLVDAPYTPDTASRLVDEVVAARPLLDGVTTVDALTTLYRGACNAIHDKLVAALPKLHTRVGTFLWEGADPTPDWLQKLHTVNNTFATSGAGIQYYYDWLKDIVSTYTALRERLSGDTVVCGPRVSAFPKHLVLGRIVSGGGTDARTGFYPSPLVRGAVDRLGHARFLYRKLKALISSWKLPPASAPPQDGIRITPSSFEDESLEARAIPYYYDPSKDIHNDWSFALTQRGMPRQNLSYHAPAYGGLGEAAKPLETNIGRFTFFRVEGQLGRKLHAVTEALASKIRAYNLPIAITTATLRSTASAKVSGARPTFESFLKQVPGLEHHGGALRGTTLLLVGDENDNFVADFMLPYTQVDSSGCCTVVLSPESGWELKLALLPAGKDAHVCFQAGEFTAASTLVIANKGRVKVSGTGAATRILGPGLEAVLRFENNTSVEVSDLYIEAQGNVAQARAAPKPHLSGALSIVNTDDVVITNVRARCRSAVTTSSSCISLYNNFDIARCRRSSARVHGCCLTAGANQVGLSVINFGRITIDDNEVGVDRAENTAIPAAWLTDAQFRMSFRRALLWRFNMISIEPLPTDAGGGEIIQISSLKGNPQNNGPLWLITPKGLGESWKLAINSRPFPGTILDRRALKDYIYGIGNDLIPTGTFPGLPTTKFKTYIDQALALRSPESGVRGVAAQGIVVAGRVAREVRILSNTVRDVVDGIHIGVSNKKLAQSGEYDSAGRVVVSDNVVHVVLMPESAVGRTGVYVGNCDSLIVEGNELTCARLGTAAHLNIEGVRVFGFIGRMASISRNYMTGYPVGVRFAALNHKLIGKSALWRVTDNLAGNAATILDLSLKPGTTSNVIVAGNRT